MDNPYFDFDIGALAQACDERAGALQACAWQTEAERNALREATAELLAAVARQLSATAQTGKGSPADLSFGELREIIATRVSHAPLHAAAAHAWVSDFAPGDGIDATAAPPRD